MSIIYKHLANQSHFAPLSTVLACVAMALSAANVVVAAEAPQTTASENEGEGIVIDAVVRYVNGDMITFNDLNRRIGEYEQDLRRRGQRLEPTLEVLQQIRRKALAEITSELLIEQFADSMKVQVEVGFIQRQIQQESIRSGRWPTLDAQREEFHRRAKEQKRMSVESFFYEKLPAITQGKTNFR